VQHEKAAWTNSHEFSLDMYCSLDMNIGHAAWTCRVDMQHEYVARTCSRDMHHRDIKHGGWTLSMDMQQGHAARTCSTDMDMLYEYVARTYSMEIQLVH
jgi:hypothetical protein